MAAWAASADPIAGSAVPEGRPDDGRDRGRPRLL